MPNTATAMSDEEDQKQAPEPYAPPPPAWRLKVLIDAPISEVKKKVVDCPQCPVFFLCQEGEGGTGYHCSKCGSTAVWIDQPGYGTSIPKDILVLDCNKHKFERADKRKLTQCVLCSGGLAQLEVKNRGAQNHIVLTVHSAVPAAERQKTLKEAWAKWTKYYRDEERAKRAEERAARKRK